MKQYVTSEASAYGVPKNIALATVEQESSFNPNAVHRNGKSSTDYGLMQVNSGNFGHKTPGANGKMFTINGNKVMTNWKYNVRVGMSLLKSAYSFASAHAPNAVPAVTYARYNVWGNWKAYNSPGTQVYRDTQDFLRKYNALGGGP